MICEVNELNFEEIFNLKAIYDTFFERVITNSKKVKLIDTGNSNPYFRYTTEESILLRKSIFNHKSVLLSHEQNFISDEEKKKIIRTYRDYKIKPYQTLNEIINEISDILEIEDKTEKRLLIEFTTPLINNYLQNNFFIKIKEIFENFYLNEEKVRKRVNNTKDLFSYITIKNYYHNDKWKFPNFSELESNEYKVSTLMFDIARSSELKMTIKTSRIKPDGEIINPLELLKNEYENIRTREIHCHQLMSDYLLYITME